VGLDPGREFRPDPGHRRHLLHRRLADALGRAERAQERPLPRGAHAGEVVEGAPDRRPAPQVAVVGDREAVRLVADPLHEVERRRRRRQDDRIGPAGHEELLALLGQPGDRDLVEAQLAQDGEIGRQLALAAVDEDQVGQGPAELLRAPLLAGLRPLEPAPQHLGVAGEVVLAGDALDPEAPVGAAARLAVLEDDHAADRLAALDRRDVVALDAQGRARKPEGRRQLLEGDQRLALVGEPARLLPRQEVGRVAGGQLDEAVLLAPLGDLEADAPSPAVGEEGLEVGRLGREGRGEDRRRHRRGPGVVLQDEAGQHLVVGGPGRRLQGVDVAADQLPVADREDLDRRLGVRAGQAEHVELSPGEGGHLLVLHRPLDRPHLVAQDGRPLVLGLPRGLLHLATQLSHQRRLAALQEELDLGDVGPVGRLPDRLDAGALAALDVVEEARPPEGSLALPDVDRAGPEGEEAADQVHRLVDAARRGVGAEVAAAVGVQLPRPLDAREVLAERDPDVRVALVVLEADVEARLVALDQVGLEEERLRDRVRQRVLDVGDAVDRLADPVHLAVPGSGRLLLPVAAHARAEVLGLADVQHGPARVAHEVDAGPGRQAGERGFELRGHAPMLHRPSSGADGGRLRAGARAECPSRMPALQLDPGRARDRRSRSPGRVHAPIRREPRDSWRLHA
jgi:hypothetical protein